MLRNVVSIALAFAVISAFVAWIVWPDAEVEGEPIVNPVAVSPILQVLGPGKTVHQVIELYRRHGPAQENPIPADKFMPERLRTEVWISFDDDGQLSSYDIETRGFDGTLYGSAAMDGDDLVVYDGVGTEQHRVVGFRAEFSVGTMKDQLSAATVRAAGPEALSNLSVTDIDGRSTQVVERRRPVEDRGGPGLSINGVGGTAGAVNSPTGFTIPYIVDLDPMEKVQRDYVLPSEFRSVKSELVIVGADGTETVVESRETTVFEVTPNSPNQ